MDIEFIKIGGDYRPVAFNFNVVKNIQQQLNTADYRNKMASALEQKLEETGKETVDDLTEEEKEDLVATQGGTDYVLYQFFYCLKEGHRKAGKEFTTDEVEINFDPETEEMTEKVVGERKITVEDVGDWISSMDEEEANKFNEFVADHQVNERQKKVSKNT